MATSYPSGVDDFADVAGNDATSAVIGSRTHSQLHNDTGDAIVAVQTELGTNPKGSAASVAARIAAAESDARTPTAHASTHASAGSDPVTVTTSQVTGLSAYALLAGATFTAPSAGVVPLTAKGASGQTANLLEARSSAGTLLASISAAGAGTFAGLTSSAAITLDAAAGNHRYLNWTTAGSKRWAFTANSTAEAGGNLGSDLQLFVYDDAGSLIGSAMTIYRVSRAVTFSGAATMNGGLTANGVTVSTGYNAAINGAGSYGGGVGVLSLKNATTAPTTNPAGGGVLYSEGGALKWRGSSGTTTTLAAP